MNNLWTDTELRKSIKAYFKMLNYEKKGTKYVKAEENRRLQKDLPGRSSKSIEYRWQNISAVLVFYKMPFLKGYLPAKNVGANVKERIWKIIQDLKLA